MTGIKTPTTRAECERLDHADPLAAKRAAFALPEGVIYLDGHSLGPATYAALDRVERTSREEWASGLIRSWNDAGWIDLPRTVGKKLAHLIGADPNEVVVTDSVSVNLFKLAAAALLLAKARIVVVEDSEFPTDQYIAEGLASIADARLIRVERDQGAIALATTGGLLIKSAVNYRTARIADMIDHERVAVESGGLIVWDLSHATGVIDLNVGSSGARLATGCTYKFLNGGPGAPAFVYVRNDIATKMQSPISGWFGHNEPFAFASKYKAAEGVGRFATGTPGVLSLAALDAALSVFDDVNMRAIATKARALTNLAVSRTTMMGLKSISPLDAHIRGGHVSVRHEEGYAIVQALIARGIIPDFRAPDAMRFGVSPLFVRYIDVWDAMDTLEDILQSKAWDNPAFKTRSAVT